MCWFAEEAQTDRATASISAESGSISASLQLGSIEAHWRSETDYYAATVALDFLSFAFVALFYQASHDLLLCVY